MTPSTVEVLLHYHRLPTEHPRHHAPAVVAAREQLLALGAIEAVELYRCQIFTCEPPEDDHKFFRTTDHGRAWVQAICEARCPA